MQELRNSFSWSFSQAKDFTECKRRYYWNRYGSWGGWKRSAAGEVRTAYRLKQMRNKWTLVGEVVDAVIHEQLQRVAVGAKVSCERAVEQAVERLQKAWREHLSERWRDDPKQWICIRELYYGEVPREPSPTREAWADDVKTRVEVCIRNFFEHVFPRLRDVRVPDVLSVARATQRDPEHFHIGRIKVYAIPDYAYRVGKAIVIHDWKTGMRREEHGRQLAIYGIWAQRKYGVGVDDVQLYAEYLESGESERVRFDIAVASMVYEMIMQSVQEMRAYVVAGDLERNEPVEREAFPKTDDLRRCQRCNYRELCHRQFATLVGESEHGE